MASGRWAGVSVKIEPYDPRWPAAASAAMDELKTALAGLLTKIEHIGSTSVVGLAAKPVIDLMAATARVAAVVARDADLAALGYERVDSGMLNRLLYVRQRRRRWSQHLHVVVDATWSTRNERLFRDYLLSHPNDARRYAELKQHLASLLPSDAEYTRGKTALIQELTDLARAERGLESVAVWEE
jgi:GrpB-like predicted nucleotidyltransferase (UPF0157 family)